MIGPSPYLLRKRAPAVPGVRKPMIFPPGPPYESISRGRYECTVLVHRTPKSPYTKSSKWVRVRYYDCTTLLGEQYINDHSLARELAKAFVSGGLVPARL
jgi:hypothetical protein